MSKDPLRALTLLEVLLATAILGFALLTMVGVFSNGLRLARQSREASTATQLARSCLERTQALGFDRIPAANLTFDGSSDGPRNGLFPPLPYPRTTVEGHAYVVNVTLANVGVYLKEVRVQVSWAPGSSTRLVTRLGP